MEESDVELLCKTLQAERTRTIFENIREDLVVWFCDIFNYCINAVDQVVNKELHLDTKMSEASVSRNRSTTIVPAGSAVCHGWAACRDILSQMNDELDRMQNSAPPEHRPRLSDEVGSGFIRSHHSDSSPRFNLNVDRSVVLLPQDEIGGHGASKVIRADQKRFFFDLGGNSRGRIVRISEVAESARSSIILPLSGMQQFHEMICYFVGVTREQLKAVANSRTSVRIS
ncbi:unnamed protein product [Spirodela intermedia]|uniref:Uncharacterized protein n=1 Tax=Spirodela intermedia TaxID=51605 RepID=A0A7I8ICE9_SPIIN|nr:unnamed protein product [Spirodela intermedia]CAA6654521.1 unnamed protein product [Spirodela intermedia]